MSTSTVQGNTIQSKSMTHPLPAGLRFAFGLGAFASFITGIPGMLLPLVVIQLSGLDPKAVPPFNRQADFPRAS